MSCFKKALNLLTHPSELLLSLVTHTARLWLDRLYLKIVFHLKMGYRLNLENPQTFSEKLQWLKLNYHKPEFSKMVDKYEAKDYVASIIGSEHITPTFGIFDSVEDIDFDALPDKFVLKCTHDSGGIAICKDKSTFDKSEALKKLKKSLKKSYYYVSREWPYKNVPRRIIAEEYIEPQPDLQDLPDNKFFCFDGKVKAMFVATERQKEGEEVKFDFFDADFNYLPFRQGHDHAAVPPQKPRQFEHMKRVAEKLSEGLPHVRVDLYELEDKILFGELTFFHFSGMMPFEPKEWDERFGDMLTLPKNK